MNLKASPPLRKLFEQLEEQPKAQKWLTSRDLVPEILEHIGLLQEPAAIPVLFDWFHHEKTAIRSAARKAAELCILATPPLLLIQLEVRVRGSWFRYYTPEQAKYEAETAPAIRLASLSTNGRHRERAVRDMINQCDLSALPFILLRLNDWVDQVQQAAIQWFASFAGKIEVGAIVQCLPILSALQERTRSGTSKIVSMLVDRVTSESHPAQVLEVMMSADPRTRLLCFDILHKKGVLEDSTTQTKLLHAPNPILGVLLLKKLRLSRAEIPNELAKQALASRSAMVRRYALYHLTESQMSAQTPLLESCLTDDSKGVRQFAQYHLTRRRTKEELMLHYESVIESNVVSKHQLAAAIAGFHELGGQWPPERYEALANHPSVIVRRAVLTAFAKTHFDHALPWLLTLMDSRIAGSLNKVAFGLLRHQPQAVGIDQLKTWASDLSRSDVVRLRALSLIGLRGKWERLPVLVGLLHDSSGLFQERLQANIRAWLLSYNRSQVQPSRPQVENAKEAIKRVEAQLGAHMSRELLALLESVTFR